MSEFSIAYAAGLIAFGTLVAQLWVPTAISFIFAGLLRDEETAASWSVAARVLHSSYWTTILRTDSVRGHAVRRPISIASLSVPIVALVIGVAGVITPLGLYDEDGIGEKEVGNFSYIHDTSAFSTSTSPRGLPFSRTCTFMGFHAPCPFTNRTIFLNGTGNRMNYARPPNLTTDIPPLLYEIFSSGTRDIGTTVSNFFDIEWRQLTTTKNQDYNQGRPFAVNLFRQVDSLALDNSIRLIEGLIVDTKSGGIGFRNHTVPQPPDRNVTWQEDILFIEPLTSCVNTNLTIDYTYSMSREDSSSTFNIFDLRLTDRGGFVNSRRGPPEYDYSNPQKQPDLWGRAYFAAYANNFATMAYLNVTNPRTNNTPPFKYLNSTFGQSFPLPPSETFTFYKAASFTGHFGWYLFDQLLDHDDTHYPNPFNITISMFRDISHLCSRSVSYHIANISNIFVACGLISGPPRRSDGGPEGIFDEGSKWTLPLYSCATAVRAIIKTVHFSTDIASSPALTSFVGQHSGLVDLRVTDITPKTYPDQESVPHWGFEDTGRVLEDLTPIWGLVSPAYYNAGRPNLTVIKQPHLYLVGLAHDWMHAPRLDISSTGIEFRQNLPGAEFPFAVANAIYAHTVNIHSTISSNDWPIDLTGRSNMAVFNRWRDLTTTPEGTAKVINLLWTDLAASAVVGTKGILPKTSTTSSSLIHERSLLRRTGTKLEQGDSQQQPVPVIHVWPTVRRIRYRLQYAIPALFVLVLLLVVTVCALGAWWTRTSTVAKLRKRLQQLSAGRIFTTVLYPKDSDFSMPPKQWSLVNGHRMIKIFENAEGAEESLLETEGLERERVEAERITEPEEDGQALGGNSRH